MLIEDKTTIVAIRIPRKMLEMISEEIKADTHMNVSDFIRECIRMELRRRKKI